MRLRFRPEFRLGWLLLALAAVGCSFGTKVGEDDSITSAPTTDTDPNADPDSCEDAVDCVLVHEECCQCVHVPTAELRAVNRHSTVAKVLVEGCLEPCPKACPGYTSAAVTCCEGRCAVVDLDALEWNACSSNSDCRMTRNSCMPEDPGVCGPCEPEAGALEGEPCRPGSCTVVPYRRTALRQDHIMNLRELTCGESYAEAADTAPYTLGDEAAACVSGHCTVVWTGL